MLFNIELSISGTIQGEGFYSNSSNPRVPVQKHRSDGISIHGKWISRPLITNWHTAQVTTLPKAGTKEKSVNPAQAYA